MGAISPLEPGARGRVPMSRDAVSPSAQLLPPALCYPRAVPFGQEQPFMPEVPTQPHSPLPALALTPAPPSPPPRREVPFKIAAKVAVPRQMFAHIPILIGPLQVPPAPSMRGLGFREARVTRGGAL